MLIYIIERVFLVFPVVFFVALLIGFNKKQVTYTKGQLFFLLALASITIVSGYFVVFVYGVNIEWIYRELFHVETPGYVLVKLSFLAAIASCILAGTTIGLVVVRRQRPAPWFVAMALIALMGLSIFIRTPYIGARYNLEHHGWLPAYVNMVQKIWRAEGAWYNKFLPKTTFTPADRHIKATVTEMTNSKGDSFYNSYPSLAHIMPYVLYQIFGLPVNEVSYAKICLAFHCLGALVVFFALRTVIAGTMGWPVVLGGLAAAGAYLFYPTSLWHLGLFMAGDMFCMPMYALALLCIAWSYRRERPRRLHLLFGATVFALCMTEWIGYLFVACSLFWFSVVERTERSAPMLRAAGLVGVFAILEMVTHYSLIDGFGGLVDIMWSKFTLRAGMVDKLGKWSLETFFDIVKSIHYGAWALLFLFLVLAVMAALGRGKPETSAAPPDDSRKSVWAFFFLATGPVILHIVVLKQLWAIHEYAAIKAYLPLALATGYCVYLVSARILSLSLVNRYKTMIATMFFSLIFLCTLSSIGWFFAKFNLRNNVIDYYSMGRYISEHSDAQSVLFIDGTSAFPMAMYYAERTIAQYQGEAAAKDLITRNGLQQGLVFEYENGKLVGEKVIRLAE